MAPVVRVKFVGDKADFDRAADDVEGRSHRLGSVLGGVGGVAKLGLLGAAGATAGLAVGLGSTIGPASDMAEAISKVNQLFGAQHGADIENWASNAADAMGLSKMSAMDAAGTFATFGKSAGLSGEELEDFAKANTQLAVDLASFNNTSPEEAINAIGSAFRGEAEPMRAYGVLLDDATMRQKALEMGIISTTKEALTPQQKVLAAQALMFDKTKDAQGDFARTSDGLAGRQKTLSAQFKDMQVRIGGGLLPIVLKLSEVFMDRIMPALSEAAGAIRAFFAAFSSPDEGITSSGFAGKLEAFGITAREVFDKVAQYWPQIQQIGQQVFTALGAVIGVVVGAIRQNWPQIQQIIATVAEVIRERVTMLVQVFQGIVTWLQANWPQIRAIVEPVLTALITAIGSFLQLFFQIQSMTLGLVMGVWRHFGDEILAVVMFVFSVIGPLIEGALGIITGIFDFFSALLQGRWGDAWNALVGIFQAAWDAFWGAWSAALEGLWNGIGRLAQLGRDIIGNLLSGLQEKWWDVFNWIAGLPGAIMRAIGDLSNLLRNHGWNLVVGFWNGLGDAWGKFVGWLWDQLGQLPGVIKSFFGIGSPSKLMMGLGRDISRGLELGISGGMPAAQAALGGLGLPDLGGLGTASGALAGGGVSVGGHLLTERDLVTVVIDGARRHNRERQ